MHVSYPEIDDNWARVVQSAAPEQLYRAPADLAVANFAGICNAASISSGVCPVGSEGKYAYHFTGAQDFQIQEVNGDGVNTGVSRWSAQVTFRYEF